MRSSDQRQQFPDILVKSVRNPCRIGITGDGKIIDTDQNSDAVVRIQIGKTPGQTQKIGAGKTILSPVDEMGRSKIFVFADFSDESPAKHPGIFLPQMPGIGDAVTEKKVC